MLTRVVFQGFDEDSTSFVIGGLLAREIAVACGLPYGWEPQDRTNVEVSVTIYREDLTSGQEGGTFTGGEGDASSTRPARVPDLWDGPETEAAAGQPHQENVQ